MSDNGYVNYFEILGLTNEAKPGDVRKSYKRKMKQMVMEIARVEITEEKRAHFLLEMAKLNGAFYLLRDLNKRQEYWDERSALMELEEKWRQSADNDDGDADQLRREYDGRLRGFLSKYIEELMLEAGRDKDCVEASNWDMAHERHASRYLRHYRHGLHHEILERLPYSEVTSPNVDWEERKLTIQAMLSQTVRQ